MIDEETSKKMFDVLYREGYSFQCIRAFRQHKELRDEIAMRATEADVKMYVDYYKENVPAKQAYAKAKYDYADEMLKARVAE